MALTGLARKVLKRAQLLPTATLDTLTPEGEPVPEKSSTE
jgi:hypothetical protein